MSDFVALLTARFLSLLIWSPVTGAITLLRSRHESTNYEELRDDQGYIIASENSSLHKANGVVQMIQAVYQEYGVLALFRGVLLEFIKFTLEDVVEPMLSALVGSFLGIHEVSDFYSIVHYVCSIITDIILMPLEHARIRNVVFRPVYLRQDAETPTQKDTRLFKPHQIAGIMCSICKHTFRVFTPFSFQNEFVFAFVELCVNTIRDLILMPLLTIRARLVCSQKQSSALSSPLMSPGIVVEDRGIVTLDAPYSSVSDCFVRIRKPWFYSPFYHGFNLSLSTNVLQFAVRLIGANDSHVQDF